MYYGAVIFDLYGTLVDNASPEAMDRLYSEPASLLGGDTQLFAKTWLEMRHERGTGVFGTVEGDVRHVCQVLGVKADAATMSSVVARRMKLFENHLVPRPTAVGTLRKLKGAGIKIGLISDCGLETPAAWDATPFAPFFDVTVFSSVAGTVKPDPKLYTAACEGLGVDASRCLYVGDGGGRELTGASAAGMHPLLIRVDYERHLDAYRPDAVEWTGPIISDISEVLDHALV